MQQVKEISGNIVDLIAQKIFPGTIHINNGRITSIDRHPPNTKYKIPNTKYILPGFIDAHIHIESSMLPPAEFARLAVVHGTVGTVSDPHEIANVLGISGVEHMIDDGGRSPFSFTWGAPPCVPATSFETAGAEIDAKGVDALLTRPEIRYLSEVMNYPGVIHADPEIMKKIAAAKSHRKPIDGHAPGLRGKDLQTYISAGISTDHESFQLDEALEKLSLGMKIIIREGSAAKNFDALHPILRDHWKMCMFGSDDKHPNDLIRGHIDAVVRRAVALGYDPLHVLSCACLHPIRHYGIDIGCLQVGDRADFIEVRDLKEFQVLQTVIFGEVVAKNGKTHLPRLPSNIVNNFHAKQKAPGEFSTYYHVGEHHDVPLQRVRIIGALDGQLITNETQAKLPVILASEQRARPGSERRIRSDAGQAGMTTVNSDPKKDILKIVVVNRYKQAPPAIGYIKGFGLKHGAIASTVAHDSHNIVAVGITDDDICAAVNMLIEVKGGVSAVGEAIEEVLPLPIAGLMSDQDGTDVAHAYTKLDGLAKELGSTLTAPFMTLSFMALPVIPHLKMTDRGLFDVDKFQHVDVISR